MMKIIASRKFCSSSSHIFRRSISSLGLWQEDLTTDIRLKIEKHWSQEVQCKQRQNENQNCFFVLPMFPYPSGNLHMGHVRVYSISDTIARFQQLSGNNVVHPIGWDSFGLPAENAAIERKIPPHSWTRTNIDLMKSQLLRLGFMFDWNRELSTCDPNYYKWTQYIFVKLFEKGLAYQSRAIVNWDPVDKTVLADEQVDELGCSWRSSAKVEKKTLTQWFIRTTKFAQKLYEGLDSKYLDNWNDIINLQKHWIGECTGMVITFDIKIGEQISKCEVWTSDPYKFLHGQFLTISSNNVNVQGLSEAACSNLTCINPITNSEMSVYVSDNNEYPEGRDVYIACPKFDVKDQHLATMLNVSSTFDDSNTMDIENENQAAILIAQTKNAGGHFVSSKLKDWLISRQRYWGTPIPIIHCPNCGPLPVPYEKLPVQLPEYDSAETGIHTLDKFNDWVNCECPKCQSTAKRETDTMDTFVDSSWYYYRFLDPHNDKMPFDKDKVLSSIPVDIYIGGKEHAVLHLYYARFMSYFLHSLGWTPYQEPFRKLVVQGMVMGQSYKVKSSGKYITADSVEKDGKKYKEKSTGEPVMAQWEKMSKSKHNGESPERLLTSYGCDLTRLLILADVPPATPRNWSDATLPGVVNWQHRLWITIRDFLKHRNDNPSQISNLSPEEIQKNEFKLYESRNYFIATTTYHFKQTHKLSVGISRLQGLTNVLRNNVPTEIVARSKEYELALASLLIMLAPVTPHFCSELWAGFVAAPNRICTGDSTIDWEKNVLEQRWPVVDNDYKLSFLCKVDGADRCDLKVRASELANLSEEKAIAMMISEESVAKRLKRGIARTKYDLYPGCRAILQIFTNRKAAADKAQQTN